MQLLLYCAALVQLQDFFENSMLNGGVWAVGRWSILGSWAYEVLNVEQAGAGSSTCTSVVTSKRRGLMTGSSGLGMSWRGLSLYSCIWRLTKAFGRRVQWSSLS
jgi:hypothetical protein